MVLTLVSNVAQSYFDLLQFDMQLDIARNALGSWEESVALARAQLQGGLISRLDLDQFKAERANAADRVAGTPAQMVQKENELSVSVGEQSRNHRPGQFFDRSNASSRGARWPPFRTAGTPA